MTTRGLRVAPFLAPLLLAFVCGHGYPRIHNTLDRAIFVEGRYKNGQIISLQVRAGVMLHAPRDSGDFEELTVRSDGETLFKLDKRELESLTSAFPAEAWIIWEVHEDGIRPRVYEK
jgi:hypothetical protein